MEVYGKVVVVATLGSLERTLKGKLGYDGDDKKENIFEEASRPLYSSTCLRFKYLSILHDYLPRIRTSAGRPILSVSRATIG
jgi:hypothetical protein